MYSSSTTPHPHDHLTAEPLTEEASSSSVQVHPTTILSNRENLLNRVLGIISTDRETPTPLPASSSSPPPSHQIQELNTPSYVAWETLKETLKDDGTRLSTLYPRAQRECERSDELLDEMHFIYRGE